MNTPIEDAVTAFVEQRNFERGGFAVHHDRVSLLFHAGNWVAEFDPDRQRVRISLAGGGSGCIDLLNHLLVKLHKNRQIVSEGPAHYMQSTISPTRAEITAHEWLDI